MHRLTAAALLAALALAGCARAPAPGFRDPGQRISSAALFDPGRFAGDWHVVAGFADSPAPGCAGGTVRFQPAGPGRFAISGEACAGGALAPYRTTGEVAGPGRIAIGAGRKPERHWVLWVDEGYRVAVIGTPSGAFGHVLSRDPVLRADLATAAREVLDFNGYDLARLQTY